MWYPRVGGTRQLTAEHDVAKWASAELAEKLRRFVAARDGRVTYWEHE